MSDLVKTLEAEALKLAEKDHTELAQVLLLSLENSADQEIELT